MSAPTRSGRPRAIYELPRGRIMLLFIVFTLFTGLIGFRLVSVQVFRAGQFGQAAMAERLQEEIVPARRGTIFDARGLRLAVNVPASRVSAIVAQIVDTRAVAAQLAPLIGRGAGEIEAALSQPNLQWVTLARRLDSDTIDAIRALKLPGIVFEPEQSRTYPFGALAAQVIGFTTNDNQGAYGVEGEYNSVIGGTPGKLVGERDGMGNVIGLSPSVWDQPRDGANVTLTLDSAVQRIIEEVLAKTVAAQNALGGTIVVQDPNTGAILGMASLPSYDPNQFGNVNDPSVYQNPAVSSVYEPGSTFKSIVMAIGIDDGVVTPDTVHNDAPGYVETADGQRITNNNGRVWGVETMWNVLERSTNLGAIFVSQRIGRERFYERLKEFGIGQPTGVDLQGEASGIFCQPNDTSCWNDTRYYTNAFGQGVAVTPLQLVNAVSAVINGGRLMQPYVVSEARSADGQRVETRAPRVVRQVISSASSQTMRAMLESVVVNGTGQFAAVPGYRIGAKTGTADIPSPNGGYIPNATIASIVGFGPVENPRFTVLVKIDRPQQTPWGETAAGPALSEVLGRLFTLYGIAPSTPAEATP